MTQIRVSDGTEMALYVSRPKRQEGRAPAILVLQEAFGVNSHILSVADRLAEQGYLAVAPELFHRTAPEGFSSSYTDFSAITPHLQALALDRLEADLRATYDWILRDERADPSRVGSIGFCLGGRATFLANAILPLRAAVSFYGGRIATELLDHAPSQHAPILLLWGGLDKHIGPAQQRAVADALRKVGKPFVDVEFSAADHGFFCEERASYQPAAARQAWALTLSFLETHLREEAR
jgi:carboxymethylenebutenolidase